MRKIEDLDAVAIILGPVIAMVIAHIFAASLADYPARGAPTDEG